MFAELKTIIIVAVLAFAIGGAAGWRVESWYSNAAYYKAQAESLQKTLKAHDEAAKLNAEQIIKDQAKLDELKRKGKDAVNHTDPGKCLTPSDTDRVRHLWD